MDFGKYNKILNGENLSQEEILHISENAETEELLDFANRVREVYHKLILFLWYTDRKSTRLNSSHRP